MSPAQRLLEAVPVAVLVQRPAPGDVQPLLDRLAAGGLFEPRLMEGPGQLAGLPAGALLLAAVAAGQGRDSEPGALDFIQRGGRILALGDTLAAWPDLGARAGWKAGAQAPLTELVLRPRPGHPIGARLDPEMPLRDRLRLSDGPPSAAGLLIDVPWHYRSQVAGFETAVGGGRLLHLGVGVESEALAQPLLQRLVHRCLHHLAGLEAGSEVHAGLLGYGAIGREHALSLSSVEGFSLSAVCDTSPARREQAGAEFPVALRESVEGLLEDPSVDLVVVGTPPSTHCEMVLRSLEAGKHVVSEKPFALTVAECDRMLEAARHRGRTLTVYQSRRWDPDFMALRSAVAGGAIGEPFYMESFIGGYSHPCGYWHSHEPISGGTIYDWGSHYFDWVLQVFPHRVVRVSAQQHKRVWHDVTNADQVRVDLLFEGGAQATFLQSDIAAALKPKWYLLGTEGAIVGEWRLESVKTRAWTGDLVEQPLAPAETPARVVVQRPAETGLHREELALAPRPADAFYRNLADHLLLAEPLAVSPEQARRTVAVMESAARSLAQDGVPLETGF